MESTPVLTNPARRVRLDVEAEPGTSANPKFDHASTLPRKASLRDADVCRMYFIAGGGLIKIGVSTNVRARFRGLCGSSPVPLKLLGVAKGNMFYESMVHSEFAHLRRHGEWFDDTPEIREFIAERMRNPNFAVPPETSHAQ